MACCQSRDDLGPGKLLNKYITHTYKYKSAYIYKYTQTFAYMHVHIQINAQIMLVSIQNCQTINGNPLQIDIYYSNIYLIPEIM